MQLNKSITYAQAEQFFKALGEASPSEASSSAIRRFLGDAPFGEVPSPFPAELDILTVSDDAFIELCDRLPVNATLFDHRHLTSSTLFPHNYDCFVVRHLNALNLGMHHHDFFELCYVWEGSCTQRTERQTFTMSAGDFLIIPPGIEHKVTVSGSKTVVFNIMVRKNALRTSSLAPLSTNSAISAVLRHFLLQEEPQSCLHIHTDNSMILKRIVKHLTQECYTNQEIFCGFAINVFNQLFCYILMTGEIKAEYLSLPDNFSLIAILREVQQNYKTVTLKALAEKYFFSEEHLSRLIRKTTGQTFSDLLRETRINQAKLLIARTELSIESISDLVGYSDASSFTKAFKSIVGLAPAQYRRQNRE